MDPDERWDLGEKSSQKGGCVPCLAAKQKAIGAPGRYPPGNEKNGKFGKSSTQKCREEGDRFSRSQEGIGAAFFS